MLINVLKIPTIPNNCVPSCAKANSGATATPIAIEAFVNLFIKFILLLII
jgi:hypothetical protein